METGKSRLYLPEERGGRAGEGEGGVGDAGKKTCRNWLSTADEGRWVQSRLASTAAVISIPSYSRYNENCVWKQCHLQRQSGKKLWSGPVQLHGSQGTVSRMWCLDNRAGPLCALFLRRGQSVCVCVSLSDFFWFLSCIVVLFVSRSKHVFSLMPFRAERCQYTSFLKLSVFIFQSATSTITSWVQYINTSSYYGAFHILR